MSFQYNDTGNALIIASKYQGKLRYDHAFQRWVAWNEDNSTWEADNAGMVQMYAINAARSRVDIASPEEKEKAAKHSIQAQNLKSITAALKIAASLPEIRYTGKWDEDSFQFHVQNGIVDLRTGECQPAKPSDNVLKISPVKFDREQTCPKWMEFLNQVFACNKPLIDYFQRCVGYTMTGEVSEQILFACHGNGANGKSTTLGVLDYILGEYATDLAASSLEKWGRLVVGEGVDLIGARFAKCEEIGEGSALDTGRVKSWTGENSMRVRPMRREWITFQPTHKLWLTFNSFPRIDDPTLAAYRRIRAIPFAAQFKDAPDKHLLGKLKAESAGILNWMIEGCRKWQAEGLQEPALCKQNLEEFRMDEDWLHRFLTDETMEVTDAQTAGSAMHNRYLNWCIREGIRKPLDHARFSAALHAVGLKHKQSNRGRIWIGRMLSPISTSVPTFPEGVESRV